MKRILGLVLIVTAVAAFNVWAGGKGEAASSGGGVVRLKLAGVTSDSSNLAEAYFKEIVEKESGGSIVVDLFPRNQLGDDRACVESTIFGDIDITVSSTSSIATTYHDLYLFDAPFLFLSNQHAYTALDGPTGKKILDGMAAIGLKGLCFWENGFRNYTNNKVAARAPADVRGSKVRTMENEIHLAAWRAFGANPTPMAFSELFTALQQGTVDAQENPLGIIAANKFNEVQKFVSMTQHVYTPYIVVMNLSKYNSLTAAQKAAVDKAVVESTKFQRETSQRLEKEIMDEFSKTGRTTVVILTEAEKSVFQKIITDNKIFDLVKTKVDHPEYVDAILGGQ
ncbi:MAG: DctP family TRAP transporter solute-binding subunit [Spirochaetaceae bacterium]|jgi:tripartite ATP-independent transporter DctP family solute receptor|nr:DctP family TRAP transporter solute-binding subunit [Spirochaetaceae bacterium]